MSSYMITIDLDGVDSEIDCKAFVTVHEDFLDGVGYLVETDRLVRLDTNKPVTLTAEIEEMVLVEVNRELCPF